MAHVFGAGNVHHLVKRLPAVIFADGITLLEADMIVRGDEYADGISVCRLHVSQGAGPCPSE